MEEVVGVAAAGTAEVVVEEIVVSLVEEDVEAEVDTAEEVVEEELVPGASTASVAATTRKTAGISSTTPLVRHSGQDMDKNRNRHRQRQHRQPCRP